MTKATRPKASGGAMHDAEALRLALSFAACTSDDARKIAKFLRAVRNMPSLVFRPDHFDVAGKIAAGVLADCIEELVRDG